MDTKENNINNLRNSLGQRVNNIANFIRTEKINFAMELQSFLEEDNHLPLGCTLLPYNRIDINSDSPGFEDRVLVDFDHPGVVLEGRIGLELPMESEGHFVKMKCGINGNNGHFLQVVVKTSDEMYQVMEFCQSLLQWQSTDNLTEGVYLERVRIPAHLMSHPCVDYLVADNIYFDTIVDENN